MEFKIYIFSDNVLSGLTKFDLTKLNLLFARNLCNICHVEILPLAKQKELLFEDSSIVFSENENLDNIIIDHYSSLGSEKDIIAQQVVVFKKQEQKIVFIPLESDLSILSQILGNDAVCQFHLFGLNKNSVIQKLEQLKSEVADLKYKVIENNILCDVYLSYHGQGDMIDDNQVKIATAFKSYMFSENELNLEKIIYQLLKMKNLSMSICENVTKGKIISSLLENADFSDILKLAQIKFFENADNEKLHKETENILQSSNCDLAVVTSGSIEGDSLHFVFTIADKKEIHFYKCNFTGKLDQSIEMAKNTCLYHLVKKLRQNDFAF